MQHNTLSVVMPNFNHGKYIGEALDAILSQSYRPIEVIVIDDASTDNSVEIIEQFVKRDPIVRLIRNEKNLGVVVTSLKLLEVARGEYIYETAADDKVLPGFFEKSMTLLARHPNAGLCSALSLRIDEDSTNRGLFYSAIVSESATVISTGEARNLLSSVGSWISSYSTIYRRDAFFESGGYIPELHSFVDGFLFMVIALRHGACYIPEPLACARKMDSCYAVSVTRNASMRDEIYDYFVHLTNTGYKNLFPQAFIDNLHVEMAYNSKMSNVLYGNGKAGIKIPDFIRVNFYKVYYSLKCKRNLSRMLWNLKLKLRNIFNMYKWGKIDTGYRR